jgi:photosystem II stability/assembly factor-like uncharacterized protein
MDEKQLFEAFHSAFDAEPHPRLHARLRASLVSSSARPQPRVGFRPTLPQASRRVMAAAMAVALAIAALAAFLAAFEYAHRPIPGHNTSKGSCHQGFYMVDANVGWRGASSRTTDGGATWTDISPPPPQNQAKGPDAECIFDASHAWTVRATGAAVLSPDQVVVSSTSDGGQTWRQSAPVPYSGGYSGALAFVDTHHGWMLLESGSGSALRTVYTTADAGLSWMALTAASESESSVLQHIAVGCAITGMTFINANRGWLTWDCASGGAPGQGPAGPVVATTPDGGRTWAPVQLPSLPIGGVNCAARPPVFSADRGAIPVECGRGGVVYSTTNGGDTWTQRPLPFSADLAHMDMVDAGTGFAFAPVGSGNDLYRTTDSGKDWAPVAKGLFVAQAIGTVDFINANSGFVFTSESVTAPWMTTDGGKTWSLPKPYRSIGDIACLAPFDPSTLQAPTQVALFSPTMAWALGALRTTDGGGHWARVAPPSVPDRSAGEAEFYLDADHAWVAETAGSSASCSDHIVVFSTSDGGRTWRHGATIQVDLATKWDRIWGGSAVAASPRTSVFGGGTRLDFVDPKNGWLMLVNSPVGYSTVGSTGPLYRTTDGGLSWAAVWPGAGLADSDSAISFSSPTRGWIPLGPTAADSHVRLMTTRDGGITWFPQDVGPACGCWAQPPIFFDERHGVMVTGSTFNVLTTSDGGSTWAGFPVQNFDAFDFINTNQGWIVVDGGASLELEYTADSGQTWLVVNSHLPMTLPLSGVESVTFADAQHGLLAMGKGLYWTTDGGRTWELLHPLIS